MHAPYKCVLYMGVYVYTCGNIGVATWFMKGGVRILQAIWNNRILWIFLRNHTTQEEVYRILSDSEPK